MKLLRPWSHLVSEHWYLSWAPAKEYSVVLGHWKPKYSTDRRCPIELGHAHGYRARILAWVIEKKYFVHRTYKGAQWESYSVTGRGLRVWTQPMWESRKDRHFYMKHRRAVRTVHKPLTGYFVALTTPWARKLLWKLFYLLLAGNALEYNILYWSIEYRASNWSKTTLGS